MKMSLPTGLPVKPEVSQKEYLKRYLSKEKGDKKKKKKVKISSSSHIKPSIIIDDDLGLPNVASIEDEEFNLDYLGDEAPQIAGIIDERPPEIKAKENYGGNKWKPLGGPEESDLIQNNSIEVEENKKANGKPQYRENKKSDTGVSFSKGDNEKIKKNCRPLKERLSSDSDLSPPRSKDNGYDKNKKFNKKRNARSDDSDLSPPRSKTTEAGKKPFSQRYLRDDDSDLSPPRSNAKGPEKDPFSKRSRSLKHNQAHSLSPRNKTKSYTRESSQYKKLSRTSESPSRDRNRHKQVHSSHSKSRTSKGSDSDLSPPRKNKYEGKKDRNRNGSDSDLSPPRNSKYEEKSKKRRPDFEPDFSSIRKNKYEEKFKRRGSDSDLSPPRKNKPDGRLKRQGSDSDPSPPKKSKHERFEKRHAKDVSRYSPPRKNKQEVRENINMDKTLDGKKAGLQDAKNLKEELRKLKEAENALYEKMKASVSGKTATAIMRDRKTGKIRDLNKEREEESKKSVKVAERENKYAKWGKGLKQIEEAEERVADYLHEMNKPLARYAGDDDLEKILKAREREGDPMLDYIRNKQSESIDLDTTGKPTYRGYYLPNRFNIRPGHRWDGVDRSNGYEKQWFERQNAKKALQEEAYKWSTSDM